MANATGKEVVILDLYPGTGELILSVVLEKCTERLDEPTATNVLAKDIFAKTETGARVAVMCDPTTVSNVHGGDEYANQC